MLLIVAHHYVVNSGLIQAIGENPDSPSAIPMMLFGAWGKTGINCFLLITGYFMCLSEYRWEKLLKLYLQIVFYTILIYIIFLITGHEQVTVKNILHLFFPIKGLTSGHFISCFLVFYLFIPFLNIFIKSLSRQQHGKLALLLVSCYSILPSLGISLPLNYIGWFSIIYILAAYIRIYGFPVGLTTSQWGWIALASVVISSLSVVGFVWLYEMHMINKIGHNAYFFISDSNKILALLTALSSFMFFKEIRIPHSRLINIVGGATFGVLLIHANSNAMRQWLWKETVDCIGHFDDDIFLTFIYAFSSVLLIFIICVGIDWFRSSLLEERYIRVVKKTFIKLINSFHHKSPTEF